jgi:hypothetical protein
MLSAASVAGPRSKEVQCFELVRIDRQRTMVMSLGVHQPTGLLMKHRLLNQDDEIVASQLHGSAVHASRSGIHRLEELAVALGVAELVEQEVDGIHGAHRVEDAAQHVHLLQLVGRGEQLFLAGAGTGDVH